MASSFHSLIHAFLFLWPGVFAAKNSKNVRLTHLRFYLHDTLSGPSPSAVRVAGLSAKNATSLAFGDIVVIDDPLTEGPSINSTLVGRAQGVVRTCVEGRLSSRDGGESGAPPGGPYNGSTLALYGPPEGCSGGGSGVFWLVRGWVVDRTYAVDPKIGDGVFELDVYVQH